MIKRHVPILMSGLALGLVLVVFRSLALAQEPVSRGEVHVPTGNPVTHAQRQESISLSAGQVISHSVSIEPVQLRIAEQVTIQARMSFPSLCRPTEHT